MCLVRQNWLELVTFAPIVLWLCCYLWMQTRRNLAKLELYRKFTNTLAVSVLLSIAWIGFEVVLGKYIWCTEISNFRDVLFLLEFQNFFFLIFFMPVSFANDLWSGFSVFNQLYFNATDPLNELWQIAWIIPAFWCLLSYALLLVICVLWAPSRNPTRYLSFPWPLCVE